MTVWEIYEKFCCFLLTKRVSYAKLTMYYGRGCAFYGDD